MSSVGIARHHYSTTASILLLWKLFLKIVSEDNATMKCREFAMQIPCQNKVLTRKNIFNVFPHGTFIIIIVGETQMRFCLRHIANPVKTKVFTDRHYCNHAWLSSTTAWKLRNIFRLKRHFAVSTTMIITNIFSRNSDVSLFHNSKHFAVMETISRNSFRRLRCNEVPGICHANSLPKQGFDSGKHRKCFPTRHVHYNKLLKKNQYNCDYCIKKSYF